MFSFKPKKVFEKVRKMDRKQAYTIGAIVIVLVVALLMLMSAVSREDDSFAGMNSRGYDLATMPFASDAAEQYLLANAYPDMRENGSTLLYSSAEKEARQQADEQAMQEEADAHEENVSEDDVSNKDEYPRADGGGAGGYGAGHGNRSGGKGAKTEIGQLGNAGMASASGSGLSATYGPTGDFRQYKGREDRGNEAPIQLNTGNARNSLSQFRSQSLAAARQKNNKMANAGKALYGGYVANSDVLGKDGVDLSKVGGLELDTSAPPSTTDLDNLDKKVTEAAKQREKQKEEEKLSFWEQLGQDLLRQAASSLVSAVMDGVGDTLKGAISGQQAYHTARRSASDDVYKYVSSTEKYDKNNPYGLTSDQFAKYKGAIDGGMKQGSFYRTHGKTNPYAVSQGSAARSNTASSYNGSTDSNAQIGQREEKLPEGTVKDSAGKRCAANLLKDGKCP